MLRSIAESRQFQALRGVKRRETSSHSCKAFAHNKKMTGPRPLIHTARVLPPAKATRVNSGACRASGQGQSLLEFASRNALSKFIQYKGSWSPNASANPFAVSGVICFLPAINSLTSRNGRSIICARSPCVHPRASSSSRMNSPGGKTSAGTRMGTCYAPSVILMTTPLLHIM